MYSKKEILSTAMKRTSEWIFSQEIPSDVTIKAGGVSLALHKFPLVSKCGLIRKLVSDSTEPDLSNIDLPELPGGAEALELAAKFCYGINFEISTENIATLRCVAEYLEMSEDYAVGNLVGRAEAYLGEVALNNLPGAISVLHKAETLLPMAEKVKLVSRCIDAIAFIACKESQFSMPHSDLLSAPPKTIVEWWAEDLTVLRIDIFQRVLIAMMARGFKQYAIGPILMLYAQKSLRGLDVFGKGRKKIEAEVEHEKRVVLETVVRLLPREKNAMSVSFMAMLLRAAIYLETTVACRLELEKRMGLQLGQAVLDDLLIPSYSFIGDTLFDVDTVQRIMTNFIDDHLTTESDHADMEHVGKLMENYLTEIASDRNLSIARFISLAELVPEQAKLTEDGMYRAIDIYLKAHPVLSDMERKKVCSLMDCQKLSREACAHAAQNDRLPVQTVVQVLYYEQQRIRDVMDGSLSLNTQSPSPLPLKTNNNPTSRPADINPELTSLKRENADLKIELVKLKMKIREMERSLSTANNKSAVTSSPVQTTTATTFADKPPLPRKSFINSVSKKLGRINPFGVLPTGAKARTKPPKDRRHSIS